MSNLMQKSDVCQKLQVLIRNADSTHVSSRLEVVFRLVMSDQVATDSRLVTAAINEDFDVMFKHIVDLSEGRKIYHIVGKGVSQDFVAEVNDLIDLCGVSSAARKVTPERKSWFMPILLALWSPLSLLGGRTSGKRGEGSGVFAWILAQIFSLGVFIVFMAALVCGIMYSVYFLVDLVDVMVTPKAPSQLDYDKLKTEVSELLRRTNDLHELVASQMRGHETRFGEINRSLTQSKENARNELDEFFIHHEQSLNEIKGKFEIMVNQTLNEIRTETTDTLAGIKRNYTDEFHLFRSKSTRVHDAFVVSSKRKLEETLSKVQEQGLTEVAHKLETLNRLAASLTTDNHDGRRVAEENKALLEVIKLNQSTLSEKSSQLGSDFLMLFGEVKVLKEIHESLADTTERMVRIVSLLENPIFLICMVVVIFLGCLAIVDFVVRLCFDKFLKVHDYETKIAEILARIVQLEDNRPPSKESNVLIYLIFWTCLACGLCFLVCHFMVFPFCHQLYVSVTSPVRIVKGASDTIMNASQYVFDGAFEKKEVLVNVTNVIFNKTGKILRATGNKFENLQRIFGYRGE